MTGVQRLLSIDEVPYGHFENVYILLYYTSLFSPAIIRGICQLNLGRMIIDLE